LIFFKLHDLRNITDPSTAATRLSAKFGVDQVREKASPLNQTRFAVKRIGPTGSRNVIGGGVFGYDKPETHGSPPVLLQPNNSRTGSKTKSATSVPMITHLCVVASALDRHACPINARRYDSHRGDR
jgi:hypothetical protein